jgi:hypothetical protein
MKQLATLTMTDSRAFQEWWATTWQEKERIIGLAYGIESPKSVIAYDWDDIDLRIPGACALQFAPLSKNNMRHIVTSYGLSQPVGPEAVLGPDAPSGEGYEIAFASSSESHWAIGLIGQLLTYVHQSSTAIGRGHRLPVWFSNSREAILGKPGENEVPLGDMRWIVAWPDLRNPGGFDSSTGYFNMLFCTTITTAEWEFTNKTSSAHILLLLAELGYYQTSKLDRKDLVTDPTNQDRIQSLYELSTEQAERELFERFSS